MKELCIYLIERQDNLNNIFGRGDENNFNSLTLIIYNHNVRAYICTFFYLKQRNHYYAFLVQPDVLSFCLQCVCVGGGGTVCGGGALFSMYNGTM